MERIVGQLIEGFGVKIIGASIALYVGFEVVSKAYAYVAPVVDAMNKAGL